VNMVRVVPLEGGCELEGWLGGSEAVCAQQFGRLCFDACMHWGENS